MSPVTVHFCAVVQALLAILDSPLNKAGAVKVRLQNFAHPHSLSERSYVTVIAHSTLFRFRANDPHALA